MSGLSLIIADVSLSHWPHLAFWVPQGQDTRRHTRAHSLQCLAFTIYTRQRRVSGFIMFYKIHINFMYILAFVLVQHVLLLFMHVTHAYSNQFHTPSLCDTPAVGLVHETYKAHFLSCFDELQPSLMYRWGINLNLGASIWWTMSHLKKVILFNACKWHKYLWMNPFCRTCEILLTFTYWKPQDYFKCIRLHNYP